MQYLWVWWGIFPQRTNNSNNKPRPAKTPQPLIVMAPSFPHWNHSRFLLSSSLPVSNRSPILVGSASLKIWSIRIYWTSLLSSGKQRWIRHSLKKPMINDGSRLVNQIYGVMWYVNNMLYQECCRGKNRTGTQPGAGGGGGGVSVGTNKVF